MLSRKPSHPVHDLHFEVHGPVVAQIQRVFVEDWEFCTGESLEGPLWFPELPACGSSSAIGIVDGPDEDLEVMPAAFFAALNAAREEVLVMTPYFLPTATLMAAFRASALPPFSLSKTHNRGWRALRNVARTRAVGNVARGNRFAGTRSKARANSPRVSSVDPSLITRIS